LASADTKNFVLRLGFHCGTFDHYSSKTKEEVNEQSFEQSLVVPITKDQRDFGHSNLLIICSLLCKVPTKVRPLVKSAKNQDLPPPPWPAMIRKLKEPPSKPDVFADSVEDA
jgi:hypothetical protein